MTFPFLIRGEVRIETTGYDCSKAVLEKLAQSVKREGGTNIAISGDVLEFSGITGQLTVTPLVNIARSTVTVVAEPDSIRLQYVMRPEIWAACVGIISIAIGIITWPLAIFPIQLPVGFGLATIVIWVCYIPIVRFRYERFLRRSAEVASP